MNSISKTSYVKAVSSAIAVYTERLTLFIVVITYVSLGNQLSGGIVFSMFQIINSLQLYISILFPLGLSTYTEAKTSIFRIEEFLTKGEKRDPPEHIFIKEDKPGLIKLENVHASRTPNAAIDTLIDISLQLKPGAFCCISGAVGSGKSSLLDLILGELPLRIGEMQVDGTISYASQVPWLFTSNVRDNILFGKPHFKKRYDAIVEVCALRKDFELFPFGDKSNVGERGGSLSGGQRARINLARAVYTEADIYLFDDPLSAVDTEVAEHLFTNCFLKYLHNKTRILVTHQAQFLERADFVLVLSNGKVEKFINSAEISERELNIMKEQDSLQNVAGKYKMEKNSTMKLKSNETEAVDDNNDEPQETQELIERGAISVSVYKEYFKAGGSMFQLITYILVFALAQLFCNATDLWVTFW